MFGIVQATSSCAQKRIIATKAPQPNLVAPRRIILWGPKMSQDKSQNLTTNIVNRHRLVRLYRRIGYSIRFGWAVMYSTANNHEQAAERTFLLWGPWAKSGPCDRHAKNVILTWPTAYVLFTPPMSNTRRVNGHSDGYVQRGSNWLYPLNSMSKMKWIHTAWDTATLPLSVRLQDQMG